MWHPKTAEFDSRLKELFDEVDHYIEDRYGHTYSLHPMRPLRGETANPEADGLFNIGALFTPGYGSELGRGGKGQRAFTPLLPSEGADCPA